MWVFRNKNPVYSGKENHTMLLSLLTKGTITWYHPAHLPVARIISKMSTLLLICWSLDPNPSPACGCHRKPFLLRTPRRRLLNLWHLLLPWPPSTEPKQKNPDLVFKHVYPRERVPRQSTETRKGGQAGCGEGYAPSKPPALHRTSHPGVGPQTHFRYCLPPSRGLIPCQSRQRCSGETGLRSIPCVKAPLIHFIFPYPFRRTMTPWPVTAPEL